MLSHGPEMRQVVPADSSTQQEPTPAAPREAAGEARAPALVERPTEAAPLPMDPSGAVDRAAGTAVTPPQIFEEEPEFRIL